MRTTVVGHPAFEPEAAGRRRRPSRRRRTRRAHGIADGGALLCCWRRRHDGGDAAADAGRGGAAARGRRRAAAARRDPGGAEDTRRRRIALRWSGEEATLVDASERAGAYASAELAIACCGTVNVELALAGTPQLAVYRASALTAFVVRWLLRPVIRYATLPNVLAQLEGWERPELLPELLFERCAARPIADAARDLLAAGAPRRPGRRDESALPRLAVADASGAVICRRRRSPRGR